MDSQKVVNPMKTGVQTFSKRLKRLDSGVLRNDEETPFGPFYETINLRCNIKVEHGLGHDGIALWQNQWVALLSFSAAAWKCAARDQWIGWSSRHQYDRLKLVVNNSRFLILPDWHIPNLGSRILSLCQKRLPTDWQSTFGHPVVLLETFVDPQHFRGTVYRAANWHHVGETRGFRRTGKGYSAMIHSPKMVFVKPLQPDAQLLLSGPVLEPPYRTGGTRIILNA